MWSTVRVDHMRWDQMISMKTIGAPLCVVEAHVKGQRVHTVHTVQGAHFAR